MAFEELKNSQSEMWGAGPFEEVEASIADMHERIVDSIGPDEGRAWLDIGCGTGGVSALAAAGGADVTGVDLAPNLIETATRRARERGMDVSYQVGDVEDLDFPDAAFGIVTSSVGAIFAPDQEAAAREMARVCAPGGRLVLTAWRPDGGVGRFFRFMRHFQPKPPPEGVGNPLDWGREQHAEQLLGGAFELEFEEFDSPFEAASGEHYWDLFSRAFGPTRVLAESMDEEHHAEFREAFIAWAGQDRDGDRIRQSRTYLQITGTRHN
jgi:SAM-dependent methyltransferase